jgi:hypothetical protein
MPAISIDVDNALDEPLTLDNLKPAANNWAQPLDDVAELDSLEATINMVNPSVVTFSYLLPSGSRFNFIVTFDQHGLFAQAAAPAGHEVNVRVWANSNEVEFDVS